MQPPHPLSPPSPLTFNPSQHHGLFQWLGSLHHVAKVLEFQLQHQSFQWIFRVDFFYDWLVWSPCSPRDSQESSPTPQFRNINSSALSALYSPALTSLHDCKKNHSLHFIYLHSSLILSSALNPGISLELSAKVTPHASELLLCDIVESIFTWVLSQCFRSQLWHLLAVNLVQSLTFSQSISLLVKWRWWLPCRHGESEITLCLAHSRHSNFVPLPLLVEQALLYSEMSLRSIPAPQ